MIVDTVGSILDTLDTDTSIREQDKLSKLYSDNTAANSSNTKVLINKWE
tara:strand:- start:1399 stop:1545 length:147 start_codon:yes stop_codon:yes gene_type:complete